MVINKGRKFLFITLSNIGDALLTTPVLQFLHRYDETATVDIVGDERSSMLFLHCPYRGEIYHKQKQRFLRGTPSLLLELRRRRYDLVVDLRTDILARLVRAEKRLFKRPGDLRAHAVEKHFSAVAGIAGDTEIPDTILWPGREDKDFADDICTRLPGKKWLCIGPGANWDQKIWPAQRFAMAARNLSDEFDALVLLGNDADNSQAEQVARGAGLPCINLCGRTSLLQAAAVMAQMTLFIGNDSGLGHMAGATGTPSFTLFGPGQPEHYRPWGARAAWYGAPDRNINSISVDAVVRQVNEHLARLPRSNTPVTAAE